jgi:hypothetical protein
VSGSQFWAEPSNWFANRRLALGASHHPDIESGMG